MFYWLICVEGYVKIRKNGQEMPLNEALGDGEPDEIRCIFNAELIGEIAAMGLNSADA